MKDQIRSRLEIKDAVKKIPAILEVLQRVYFYIGTLLWEIRIGLKKQECIPVGCVPSTSVAVSPRGGGGWGLGGGDLSVGPGGVCLWVRGGGGVYLWVCFMNAGSVMWVLRSSGDIETLPVLIKFV